LVLVGQSKLTGTIRFLLRLLASVEEQVVTMALRVVPVVVGAAVRAPEGWVRLTRVLTVATEEGHLEVEVAEQVRPVKTAGLILEVMAAREFLRALQEQVLDERVAARALAQPPLALQLMEAARLRALGRLTLVVGEAAS
jgi:hypothetical protein